MNLEGVRREEALKTLRQASQGRGLVANLECLLTSEPEVSGGYRFSAPIDWAADLATAGIIGFGLANNHALDCGERGLLETIAVLRAAGIQVTGAGQNVEEALEPVRFESIGKKSVTVVFAVNCINTDLVEVTPQRAGVLSLPRHRDKLAEALRREKLVGNHTVVMAHWGREGTVKVTNDQREWARWLIAAGADEVVGAHPHVVQGSDFWRGKRVRFSLGNLVFPELKARSKRGWKTAPEY